jgi:hypothetical protein
MKSNLGFRSLRYCLLLFALLATTATLLSAKALQTNDDLLEKQIAGSSLELGKKTDAKYEVFKYDEFHTVGCEIQWREVHQVLEHGKQVSFVTQDLRVALGEIDARSIRTDKYHTGWVVSFTVKQLERRIKVKAKNVYPDATEETTISLASGAGFYFSQDEVATKVAEELLRKTRWCQGNL